MVGFQRWKPASSSADDREPVEKALAVGALVRIESPDGATVIAFNPRELVSIERM
jgi:hypothetical protein